jgi:Zn-finger nucleic acid-binding protein
MKCPHCQTELKKAIFHKTEISFCPQCLGMFFDKDGLRLAKDDEDQNLRWLDIDLWQNKSKFTVAKGSLLCPVCRLPLYAVEYGDSGIKVEICLVCHGVWLERGEFRKIVDYLEQKAQYQAIRHYWRDLAQEIAEVFVGPEPLKEELLDVLAILKLLSYRLAAEFPGLERIISQLPK